ncbi:hypothetical protein [Cellulomonas sp. PhB143]|uniref:hypothetical protein n=1 Tax=Cellulomonas sp. PhB143 TaxID=2485186 RepID=UPI000F49F1D1|nr:hypothetical protein [Cellulomonas sp. PhB143]ROS74292.1 hypothetical protein EDF32_2033 [Cellulomonas sp. PhB143]
MTAPGPEVAAVPEPEGALASVADTSLAEAVRQRLAGLDDTPVAEHADAFEQVRTDLEARLRGTGA